MYKLEGGVDFSEKINKFNSNIFDELLEKIQNDTICDFKNELIFFTLSQCSDRLFNIVFVSENQITKKKYTQVGPGRLKNAPL